MTLVASHVEALPGVCRVSVKTDATVFEALRSRDRF